MSSREKGRRTLNSAKDYLNENGFIVDEVELGGQYRKYKDLFAGLCIYCWSLEEDCCTDRREFDGFDLVAVKSELIVLVQVKTNSPATQLPYKEFAKQFGSDAIEIWVMTKYDYKGFRIQKYQTDGSITEIDNR